MSDLIYMKPEVVRQAYDRIKNHINHTPIFSSHYLNELLGAELHFKFEGMQKIGAFKTRGALNTLLSLKEKGKLPKEVVAYSSGNHAQAVAWAARLLGLKAVVYIPSSASPIKVAATKAYGAEVISTHGRQEAEDLAHARVSKDHAFLLPPYDHDDVIAGQGTAVLEAWQDLAQTELEDKSREYDAIFVPCGGGGLVSGSYLATRLYSQTCKVFAVEPENANDASMSYKSGKVVRYDFSPKTIADGVRTLGVSERTFQYIKQLDDVIEVSETAIIYWTQWLTHLLKLNLEPCVGLAMAGTHKWLKDNIKNLPINTKGDNKLKILVVASGGNIDPSLYPILWEHNYLTQLPKL